MKVAVLSIYPFPYGMAATNRIAAYTQGLVENEVSVDVISILPPEPATSEEKKMPDEGWYNGVHYYHPSGRYRSCSKILRALAIKTGFRFWKGVYSVRKLLKKNNYDAVILSFDEPKEMNVYAKISKQFGAKVLFIFDEYPTPIRHELKESIPKSKEEAYKSILCNVDGYISISEELSSYYNSFVKHSTCILPVIVNTQKFAASSHSPRKNMISYIGNMELTKDNIDNIILAFDKIASKYPDYTLHFFGPKREDTITVISKIVNSKRLQDRVIIEGLCPNDRVPEIIRSSKVMVSSQPNTIRAKGGFPTKLGEYVASKTPTLLCDVGENRKYISDEDCFYSDPDNPDLYAKRLDYILSNYDQALKIAEHGRQSIINKYSHISAGKKIKDFIDSLL